MRVAERRLRRQRVGPGCGCWRRPGAPADLPRAARSAGAVAGPLRLHRRRRARDRSCSASSAPSGSTSSRCTARPSRAGSPSSIRTTTCGRRRSASRPRTRRSGSPRPARSSSQPHRVPRLLQESGGHRAGARRRLAAHGDAGLVEDDGHLVVIDRLRTCCAGRRLAVLARADREQAQVQPVRARGGGGGRGPAVRGGADPDRHGRSSGNWAESSRLPFTTFKDLVRQAGGLRADRREVARVNDDLPRSRPHPAPSRCSTRSCDADDDELTRTNKVRRSTILGKYRDMIDGLYAHAIAASGGGASSRHRQR